MFHLESPCGCYQPYLLLQHFPPNSVQIVEIRYAGVRKAFAPPQWYFNGYVSVW